MQASSIHALAEAARTTTMLTQPAEHELATRAARGDERAFEQLVRAHLPLVFAMAAEYRWCGSSSDELVGEALLGLVKAARAFDPERGTRLAAYAAWWIRAHLRSFSLANRRIVRGPSTRNARKVLGSLRRTERELGQQLGHPPDSEALANALGVKASDIEDAEAMLARNDVPYGRTNEGRGFEVASDSPSPETLVADAQSRHEVATVVHQALRGLDPRSRRILSRRYLQRKTNTLAELGDELGLSRERIRQLELQAKAEVRAKIAERCSERELLSQVA